MLSSKNYMAIQGLSAEEVERSRKEHGENTLPHKKKRGFFRQFLSNFGDPLIKILLAALCVNVVMLIKTADWYESVGIAVAVFLATFVSTLSEYGSEAAFEKMQAEAEQIQCRVIRDGALANIPIGEIVVGDFILLERGERIPADGVLYSGELMVNQAALNGESKEAAKKPGRRKGQWSLSAQHQLFRGSIVTDGEGVMEVCMVGQHTMYGSMALEMQEETRESPLRVRLNHLAKILSRIGMVAAILVGFADLFHSLYMDYGMQWSQMLAAMQNLPWLIDQVLHALTLSITVVVVAVPEGLPMMITIVLSANMRRCLLYTSTASYPLGNEGYAKMDVQSGSPFIWEYARMSVPSYSTTIKVTGGSGSKVSTDATNRNRGVPLGGSTNEGNNMPPYIVCRYWIRIA